MNLTKELGERYKDLINEEENQDIKVENISMPVYESKDLLERKENDGIISVADIIIISIGSNDLNRMEYEDALSLDVNYNDELKFIKKIYKKLYKKSAKLIKRLI
jgi:hypothetical protein